MVEIDRLKRFKIFEGAPASLLEKLSATLTEKKFTSGAVICKEGDAGGALYVIESGKVAVEKKAFHGEAASKIIARLESGEFFGEMAFLQGLPHSATVTAQDNTTLFLLTRSSLDDLAKKDAASALDQVLTVAMGLSNRLRSTTRELVTVFEVARSVAEAKTIDDLAANVVGQLQLDLGASTSVAFYRWNMFNDEYSLLVFRGQKGDPFPNVLSSSLDPLPFEKGKYILSRIDMLNDRQGLLVYLAEQPNSFDAGERQMMDTVAAVLAPALASARHREEEESRERLIRSKQSGYTL